VQIRGYDADDEDGDGDGSEDGDSGSKKNKATAARKRRMEMAMPRCAIVGFTVKGWLASGVRVDSLKIVGGRGIGESVKPYKGVKYITRAGSVEVRC
jgi:hypothetical protein